MSAVVQVQVTKLRAWPGQIDAGISPEDAKKYCVQHADWQRVRLKMKGQNTEIKLGILHEWYERGHFMGSRELNKHIRLLQVINYLGALRRGGQLDEYNRIKKER